MKRIFILITFFCYLLGVLATAQGPKKHPFSYSSKDSDKLSRGLLFDKDFTPSKLKFAKILSVPDSSYIFLRLEKFIIKDETLSLSESFDRYSFVSSGAQIFKEITQKHA